MQEHLILQSQLSCLLQCNAAVITVQYAATRETFFNQSETTTQMWVVTRMQYAISALVPQTSFRGQTSGRVAK